MSRSKKFNVAGVWLGQQHPPARQGAGRTEQPERGDPGQRQGGRLDGVDLVRHDGE
ncbi:hypothetical protein [Nonomuraea sp. NPDC046570]|uniref:hypothetical protein n=1 Tax=Nonomuraea sp. NPDC046570 TaxID=3155255 RepID=UPI0033F56A29